MQGELDHTQINNILSSRAVGRLACTDGTHPYIVPVTYAYDGTYIYGQTNDGHKLNIMRKNPHVCFETDVMTDMCNWQSVIVYGRFEELNGEESEKAREILFGRVYSLKTENAVHPFGHEANSEVKNHTRVKQVMYRIKIVKMTGRFEN